MIDPNPLVKGKGVKRLKEAGIDVEVGLLQKEAIRLNEVYITYITKKRPFTILKMAMSLDGKIRSSKQRWISCELSRRYVQRLRNSVDAILVGKSTILADNPNLTINIKPVHKIPYKIVVDSKLQIDTSYNIFKEPKYLILATTELADKSKIKRLKALGVKVLVLPTKENKVDLTSLWQELAKLEISSVLLEGGARLAHSALWANLVDKVIFFIAPKFIGGEDINAVWGEEFPEWIKLKEVKHKLIGEDLMISGYINLPE
jgi:diaminohydroxyphosphoribosylaminopyrimidine deaminase/5-amino-6-(5-phosphoribosylamino)uracil reductase